MKISDSEADKMFKEAGVTHDDLHAYIKNKYNLDDGTYEKEDVEIAIKKILEWKNESKN